MKQWFTKILVLIGLAICLNIVFSISAFADEEKAEVIVVYKDKSLKEEKISKLNVKNEEVLKELPIAKMTVPESEIKTLEKNPNVKAVALNEKVKIYKPATTIKTYDTTAEQQYNLNLINVYDAWKKGYKGKGVKIAIIDGGVEKHKDLNVVGGKSFISGKTYYDDEDGHGTHVAGIINSLKTGVAPESLIYSLKIFNGDYAEMFDIIQALDWAIANDIDIVNMSLGLAEDNAGLKEAIQNATKKGILLVAASGNMEIEGFVEPVLYPAAYSEVISVASVDQNKKHSYFSNVGLENELSAPGEDILSTYLNNKYEYLDGTSMATPHVTGLLAILKQRFPNYSASMLRKYITDTALDLGIKGRDRYYGYGLARFLDATTSKLSASKITVINNYGKQDVIKFNNLLNNRTYTIYKDSNLEHKIVSFKARSSSNTVNVQQLGIKAGAIFITEKESGYGESVPIKVSYKTEQLPAISQKNVTVKNNVKANDQIVLKGLTKGFTYTVYSDSALKKRLAFFTATSSSKTISIKQVGAKAGNIYIVASKQGYKASAVTKVKFNGEMTPAISKRNVKITNSKKQDTIIITGLKKGSTIVIYKDAKKLKKLVSFKATNSKKTLKIKQLGKKAGKIYITAQLNGYRVSSTTAVSYTKEK